MQSLWHKHLIVWLFLGLLIIPVCFLDKAATEGGGSNWISFDFRGVIFWTYVVLFTMEVVISSTAILLFPNLGIVRIHLASILLAIILFITGFIIYGQLLRARSIS